MSKTASKEKKKLSKTQVVLLAGFGVLLTAVIVIGVLLLLKSQEVPATSFGAGNVVLDEDNGEDLIAELTRKAAEGQFEVKMNAEWSFPNGASPSTDAYVANSRANRLPVYFEVTLGDNDDSEVIYTSPEIPVGSAVKDITLTKDLPAGDYETVCTYHLLNEDKTVRSSVSVVVRLHIEA